MADDFIPVGEADALALDFGALACFSRFRRHPGFTEEEVARIAHAQYRSLLGTGHGGFLLQAGGRVLALCVVVRNDWESEFFGLPMARLHFHAAPGLDRELLVRLCRTTLEEACGRQGLRHVSAELDVDDYVQVNTLIRLGFEMMDLKRTYFTNRLDPNPPFERLQYAVAEYRPEDFDEVAQVIRTVEFTTRLSRDPAIPAGKAREMYQRWFHNLLDVAGRTAQVLVFRRRGRITGCGGMGELDLTGLGVPRRIRSGSLYACTAAGVGGYGPVLYRMTRDAVASHGLIEGTVSLNNPSALRVIEGVRPNRSVTTYCMRLLWPSAG